MGSRRCESGTAHEAQHLTRLVKRLLQVLRRQKRTLGLQRNLPAGAEECVEPLKAGYFHTALGIRTRGQTLTNALCAVPPRSARAERSEAERAGERAHLSKRSSARRWRAARAWRSMNGVTSQPLHHGCPAPDVAGTHQRAAQRAGSAQAGDLVGAGGEQTEAGVETQRYMATKHTFQLSQTTTSTRDNRRQSGARASAHRRSVFVQSMSTSSILAQQHGQ